MCSRFYNDSLIIQQNSIGKFHYWFHHIEHWEAMNKRYSNNNKQRIMINLWFVYLQFHFIFISYVCILFYAVIIIISNYEPLLLPVYIERNFRAVNVEKVKLIPLFNCWIFARCANFFQKKLLTEIWKLKAAISF